MRYERQIIRELLVVLKAMLEDCDNSVELECVHGSEIMEQARKTVAKAETFTIEGVYKRRSFLQWVLGRKRELAIFRDPITTKAPRLPGGALEDSHKGE